MAAVRKDRDALAWFAEELRAHRIAHGWTQADLAAKIGRASCRERVSYHV